MSRRRTSEEAAEDPIDTIGVAVVKMVNIRVSFTLRSRSELTWEMMRRRLAKSPFPGAAPTGFVIYDGQYWNYHFRFEAVE